MPPKKRKKPPFTAVPGNGTFKRMRTQAAQAQAQVQQAQQVQQGPPPPPPPPPPQVAARRGDGVIRVQYMRMGLGDCAILTTPLGKNIVVDCGCTYLDTGDTFADVADRAQTALYDDLFLGGGATLDVLILTHPDADHYNMLSSVLRTTTTIRSVYHSWPIAGYGTGDNLAFLRARVGSVALQGTNIKEVVHNNDPTGGVAGHTRLNGVDLVAGIGTTYTDALDGDGGIVIVNEAACKVTIFAAGVEKEYLWDKSTEANRGSIVTLVEGNNEKLLFCGDGTINTEQYLLNTGATARFAQTTLATIGHHASDKTSSNPAFVAAVAAKSALASAGQNIKTHALPSSAVLGCYKGDMVTAQIAQLTDENWIRSWTGKRSTWQDLRYPIYTTGSTGVIAREYAP